MKKGKSKNLTMYIASAEDRETIDRARKLLSFHEDKSLGDLLADAARAVVKKYEGAEESEI